MEFDLPNSLEPDLEFAPLTVVTQLVAPPPVAQLVTPPLAASVTALSSWLEGYQGHYPP